MKRLLTILLVVSAISTLLLVFLEDSLNEQTQYSNESSQEFLRKRLSEVAPGSAEAIEIEYTLQKLRQKIHGKRPRMEDPGAFQQALREIKTGVDGSTYSPNYKFNELEKARSFKTSKGLRTKNLDWKSRGPGNVSGRGRSMAVDPADASGNTWFVATVGGGVWKTTDAGLSWEHKTPGLTTLSTTTIAISQSNPDVIYLGTGMGYGRVVDLEGSGIWKSIDHGESWRQLESTANGELYEAINRIVVDPNNENVLLACSNNSYTSIGPNGGDRQSGIFRSEDGGRSWLQVFDPDEVFTSRTDNRVQQIIANPEDFDELYAAVNEVGIIKSIDAGKTWFVSTANLALPQDIGQGEGSYRGISTRIEMAVSPSDTDRIYASVERPYGIAQLFMSQDAGNTWNNVQNNGTEINWHSSSGASGQSAYTSGWFNNTIAVHPFDEDVVFVGGVNLFRIDVNPSNNTRTIQPAAWWFSPNEFGVQTVHADNHFLLVIPDGGSQTFRIICPNDGGLAYSTDGGNNWSQVNGMISTQFYGVDKKPGEEVYIGGMQDNGSWISGTDTGINTDWIKVLGGDGFETIWNYKDPNLVLGTSQNGFVYRSDDGGESWRALLGARGSGGPFISKIANAKTDPDLIFTVTRDGINRSDDFGLNWSLTNLSPWIGYRPFSNVKVSISNPQVVWASSRFTLDPFGNTGGVHVSRDGGLTFQDITTNLPPGISEASGLATHPTLEGTAFLLFSAPGAPKVLRTDDYGETWIDLSGFGSSTARLSPTGFPDVAVFTLVVMPYDNRIIWAGTEIGLFVSKDEGATWALAENGFPIVSVFDMKIVDSEMVIATYGRGIWTAEIPELDNYDLPEPILSPRLKELALIPEGDLKIKANLRSEYDSVYVYIDNKVELRLLGNDAGVDTTLLFPVTADKTVRAWIEGYRDGRIYGSSELDTEVFVTSPQESYTNLFRDNSGEADFLGEGYSIRNESGFSSFAIHSPHPYPDQSELIYMLKVPIIISEENAFFRYKDVVVVEEGESGSYTNSGFYDYVIVEATSDGTNWLPLVPGYDSRRYSLWSSAYNNNAAGDESMFQAHDIDLLDTFEPGQTIFIRFRLYADQLVNGWGWAIDDVIIQDETVTSIQKQIGQEMKIWPNPASKYLNIEIQDGIDQVMILNINGQVVQREEFFFARKSIEMDISEFERGIYIVQVSSGQTIISKRFIKE